MTPYRPSNGTEGEIFMTAWCGNCERDRDWQEGNGDSCEIACNAVAYHIDDLEYPKEWRCDGPSGPRCTAWVAAGDDIPPPFDPGAVVRDLFQ